MTIQISPQVQLAQTLPAMVLRGSMIPPSLNQQVANMITPFALLRDVTEPKRSMVLEI